VEEEIGIHGSVDMERSLLKPMIVISHIGDLPYVVKGVVESQSVIAVEVDGRFFSLWWLTYVYTSSWSLAQYSVCRAWSRGDLPAHDRSLMAKFYGLLRDETRS